MKILTDSELMELTGYRRSDSIKRWLDDRGIRYDTSSNGWPKVVEAVYLARLGIHTKQEPRLNLA